MKVSVIIPVYNSEKTILDTLVSVKNQTYKPLEIVIIDDGSFDNSKIIIETFATENPRLQICYTYQTNKGVSSARNYGLKIAKGSWVALLDADDTWDHNKLKRQKEILEANPQIDFLGTNRNNEKITYVLWKKFDHLTHISPKLLLIKSLFPTPTVLFRKNVIEKIGFFDENQHYMEDSIYFIKIANKFNSYLLNESLVITGQGKSHFGESGLSANIIEMQKGNMSNIKTAFDLKIINRFEYLLIYLFSILKYYRRILVLKLKA